MSDKDSSPSVKDVIDSNSKEEINISEDGNANSINAFIKTEKYSDDIEGGELDYEEEILQLSSEKKDKSKENENVEEGEDEGEISGEEDDLEEGELKDGTSAEVLQSSSRQICRFFTRGQCYYGTACRFLHSADGKGTYNMFARCPDNYASPQLGTNSMLVGDRSCPPVRIEYIGTTPMQVEQSYVESAWERGLREAKELVKKANKRKEEPDFDKKKKYLGISFDQKKANMERIRDVLKISYASKLDPSFKNMYDYQGQLRNARGSYENFEIHYNVHNSRREDMAQKINSDHRNRERSRVKTSVEKEQTRYAAKDRIKDRSKVKDERALMHTRAFEYIDPWRRSKTPKARGGRSRSGSYSSVSSSYSGRSPSGSYSRSSSRSSCVSSRSASVHKQKSPDPDKGFSKSSSNNFLMVKKKPTTASSRSRSLSSISASRSRSYSRSISMDSVSSDSSCVSNSSCESSKNYEAEKGPTVEKKPFQKLPLEMLDEYRKQGVIDPTIHDIFEEPVIETPPGFISFRHLIPGMEKESKQPIKLTLLQKPSTSKATTLKKELVQSKLMMESNSDFPRVEFPTYTSSGKRPLSPTMSALYTKSEPLIQKKSASSRRDELLKQLKAVEDAIARKRAKFC